jgi:dihydroorotate dehydrogenase subfamily 2
MHWQTLRNGVMALGYQRVLKPLLFKRDPEAVHDRMTHLGHWAGEHRWSQASLRLAFGSSHPTLAQTFAGIQWPVPVGLAAGFDKNAELIGVLPAVGFGHIEIGSVTGQPCAGNAKPRLWRLPKSQSIAVYYGLKNDGAAAVCARLKNYHGSIPLGISIAKTNNQETCNEVAGIADYIKAYSAASVVKQAAYITINISCPNTFGGEPFTQPDKLDRLLHALDQQGRTLPWFLKLPCDVTPDQLRTLVAVARKYQVTGLICSNLTKRRGLPTIKDTNVPKQGGLSGKVVAPLADALIQQLYKETGDEFIIVGCGGIFSAEDAYHKIKLGAHLLQLVTGMIYQGPQLISQIHFGLETLLRRDGYTSLAEARGTLTTAQHQQP